MSNIRCSKTKEKYKWCYLVPLEFYESSSVEKQEFFGEITDCFQQFEKLYSYFLRDTNIKRKQWSTFMEEAEGV